MVNNTSPYIKILEEKGIEYWPEKGGMAIDGPVWEWDKFVELFKHFASVESGLSENSDSALDLFSGTGFVYFGSQKNAYDEYQLMLGKGLQINATAQALKNTKNYSYRNSSWCSPDNESLPTFGEYLLPCDAYLIKGIYLSEETGRTWSEEIYIKFCLVPDGRCVIFVSFHPPRY